MFDALILDIFSSLFILYNIIFQTSPVSSILPQQQLDFITPFIFIFFIYKACVLYSMEIFFYFIKKKRKKNQCNPLSTSEN